MNFQETKMLFLHAAYVFLWDIKVNPKVSRMFSKFPKCDSNSLARLDPFDEWSLQPYLVYYVSNIYCYSLTFRGWIQAIPNSKDISGRFGVIARHEILKYLIIFGFDKCRGAWKCIISWNVNQKHSTQISGTHINLRKRRLLNQKMYTCTSWTDEAVEHWSRKILSAFIRVIFS